MMPGFMASLSLRVIGGIVAAILAVALLWTAMHFWQKSRSVAAQSKIDNAQGGAFQNSAGDAINTLGNAATREHTSDAMTQTNEKEIRNAPGANDAVNPASRDALMRSLCRRDAYRSDPKCRLLNVNPK